MALPGILSPGEPQASESVASGPAKIQANNQALADFLGIPQNVQLTSPAFSITTAGVVTISQPGTTVVADPTIGLGIATKQYVDGKAITQPTGTAAGTNTYTTTLAPAPANLAALTGIPVTVKFSLANTGASTLNPNALGAVAIVKDGNVALAANDILAGAYYILVYDGVNFQLQIGNPPPLITTAFNKITLSSVVLVANVATVLGTIIVTMPSAGGPWRPLVQYRVYLGAPLGATETWVSDGTNMFANYYNQVAIAQTTFSCTENTPVTYANGAAVTFTINAQSVSNQGLGGSSPIKSAPSIFQILVESGN